MKNELRLQLLFNKYLQRGCTQEEIEELIALLQQTEADKILNEQMLTLWKQVKEGSVEYPVDWDKMYNRVTHTEDSLLLPGQRKNSISKFWYGVAAIIILCISGITIYMNSAKPVNNNKPSIVNTITPKQSPSYDPKQTIHLPDGSTVVLNTGSNLNYPPVFNGINREVYLSGEAYFDIKHNPKQPFLVRTEKITTKVLGTAFDIKAYPGDESIQVTVARGKVQVLKENKSLGFVTENQQITFSKKTEDVTQNTIDIKPIIAWKPLEIFFDDITMQEAAQEIQKRFAMEVTFINPAIENCRITATFSEDDSPDEILTVICGVIKATYTIQNNKITIDGEGCN
jgi:hypothetical protein